MIIESDGVFLGQRIVLYRPDSAESDGRFLLHAMRSPGVQAQIKAFGSGATVEHMRVPDCGELLIPCPDVAEQKRIGSVFGAFDELIAINERRIKLLEDLTRSLYREWFVLFRFPNHEDVELVDSDLGPIPEGWEVAPLGAFVTLNYGKALPAKKRRPGPFAVVSSAGIIDAHEEALVKGPGVVIGRKGNVGSVWWVDRDFFPIDTTYYVGSEQPLGLLYWQLADLRFVDAHAAVPGLSREQAYALPLVRPDADLSKRFGEIHMAVYEMTAVLKAQNRHVAATRDLLLPRLVTGRLDISELDLGGLDSAKAA